MKHLVIFALMLASLAEASLPAGASSHSTSSVPRSAICRVHNQLPRSTNVGSGTLVDVKADRSQGLVLTCWHLFREGTGQVLVQFPDGSRHGARVVALDEGADLAALAIANPRARPVACNFAVGRQAKLQACGFGQSGQFRCVSGASLGNAKSSGQQSLLLAGAVRSGDSGGGVFDRQGRLVAVIWGERDGVTYASYGTPLRNFLGRILGRRPDIVVNCPNGICPRQPTPTQPLPSEDDRLLPIATVPPDPGTGEHSIVSDPRFAQLAEAIAELRQTKQDKGDYLSAAVLSQFRQESTERHNSLVERIQNLTSSNHLGIKAGGAAISLLGLSGPAAWVALAAGTVGAGILGRWWGRRGGAGGHRGSGFR